MNDWSRISEDLTGAATRMRARAEFVAEAAATFAAQVRTSAQADAEAILQSSRIAAEGSASLAQAAMDDFRRQAAVAVTMFQTAIVERNPSSLLSLPVTSACANGDAVVYDGSKLVQSWMNLAAEVAQPVVGRLQAALDAAKTNAAD